MELLDREPGAESDVVPVKLNKDNSFAKKSGLMAAEDFEAVSGYVRKLIKKSGQSIVKGDVEIAPYELGDQTACKYCSFKSVCGFDPAIPGFNKKKYEKLSDDEALERIKTDPAQTN